MASSSSSFAAPALHNSDVKLATRAGIQSIHSFLSLFSDLHPPQPNISSPLLLQQFMEAAAMDAIAHFKHLYSLLSRTGHARVRHGPRIAAAAAPVLSECTGSGQRPNQNPNNLPPRHPADACLTSTQITEPDLKGQGTPVSTSFDDEEGIIIISNDDDDDDGQFKGRRIIDLNKQDSTNSYMSANNLHTDIFNLINADFKNIRAPFHNSDKSIDYVSAYGNPPFFDLNQQAPSLDSSPSLTNSTLTFPNLAFPAHSHQSFPSDALTHESLPLSSSPSPSPSPLPNSDDEFADRTQGLALSGGHNQGSFSSQLAQIKSTNPPSKHLSEGRVEKSGFISTLTQSQISCISLEGSLPAYGSRPPVQQHHPQSFMAASMDHRSGSVKRKHLSSSDDSKLGKNCGNSPANCHCSAKRRKLRNKSIKKVPAISEKVSEIPSDEYSWRKYGQKPIKGSPYPRGYYRCSGVKGCPAKKHVERAPDDPSMLIVTYEGEHIHSRLLIEEPLQD